MNHLNSNNDLISRINAGYSSMSKGQKLIANYISDYYDEAVFLTAAGLGKAVGVSESTVVRFAMALGYKGYPEFQRELESNVRDRLIDTQSVKVRTRRAQGSDVLTTTMDSDIHQLQQTEKDLDQNAFNNAVGILMRSSHVYIIGIGVCAPLAMYLSYYLKMLRRDVELITSTNANEIFEQLVHITDKDAVFGISFPRYSLRTLKAMEFANQRNAKVISLTDSVHSPMNLYSSCNLVAHAEMTSVTQSLAAPMSVIAALIVALVHRRRPMIARQMKELESVWKDFQVEGDDSINPSDDSIQMHYPQEDL